MGEEALRLMDEHRIAVHEWYTRRDGGTFEKRR